MACEIAWHEGAVEELAIFPMNLRRTIVRKIEHIAANIPGSLRLKSVQPVKEQQALSLQGRLYELDIGRGIRAAFVLSDDQEHLVVYLVGNHDYALENYLKAAEERLT